MGPARFPFLDHDGLIPFAHRGGSEERPENTLAAFAHAVELGYQYLETDAHVTADGVVVALHDPTLDRMTDRSGAVADLSWEDVAAARVAGAEPVPRLADLLAQWPDVLWNIDAKVDDVVAPLLDVVAQAGAEDRVCITSFSDQRIARIRTLSDDAICTSAGRGAVTALRAASLLPPAARWIDRWRGAAAAQVPVRHGRIPVVDRRFVRFCHDAGLQVHVWTVDDEAEMIRLVDLGVDGIMTDRPTLLRNVLRRRGVWS